MRSSQTERKYADFVTARRPNLSGTRFHAAIVMDTYIVTIGQGLVKSEILVKSGQVLRERLLTWSNIRRLSRPCISG